MKAHLQSGGGVLMDGQASMPSKAAVLLRMLVAFVLCCGLMIPSSLVTQRAWADDPEDQGEEGTAAVAITEGQQKSLRMSSDTGTVYVSLENVTDEWIAAVTSVTVTPYDYDTNSYDTAESKTLSSDQYTITSSNSRITFTRTADDPVFSVEAGEGESIDITSWRGTTTTYPQSKKYQITIQATDYADTVGEVTFYTGTSATFSIIIDEDGDEDTTEDQTVVKEFTQAEIEALATFQNGSSQCGMTGFRTFSGVGVSLTDLLEQAGVTVSESDYFLLDTTDHYGNYFTYEELFDTTRYFLESIYTDSEVQNTYLELVDSDDEAGALIELRKLLAEKALADETTVEPMIAIKYVESMIYSDDILNAVLPTESNTTYNSLVSLENQYRFIYGIAIVQEDCEVTFETGEGSEVASQTVKSHYMTSTANTTMWSSYWASSLIIYRGAGEESSSESTAAETLTVPEDPTREGYVFAGWYTQDGTETGDWGEEFDFTANDGTVDTDTTLYAKWVLAEDAESTSGTSGSGSSSGSSTTSTVSDSVSDTADDDSTATSGTLAKTGDSTPVLPIVCVTLGAAILALIAFMARRKSLVRLGRFMK